MHPRSVRLWLACACPVACSLACALPGSASARLTIGVSDNLPAMFSQGTFLHLHVPVARVGLPWNTAIMRDRRGVQAAQAWLAFDKPKDRTSKAAAGALTSVFFIFLYTPIRILVLRTSDSRAGLRQRRIDNS